MKKLLGVSGGPDSMALLHKYRRKNIVVAHVNYQLRSSALRDEKIVTHFCRNHNIPCYVKRVNTKPKGNLQAWARHQRYVFFADTYANERCKKLLLAHQKDDFLETALMQQQSKRHPSYYGIRKHHTIYTMNVCRPFVLRYWKNDLSKKNKQHHVDYADDPSNKNPVFTRTMIRNKLLKKTPLEKSRLLKWFCKSNQILAKRERKAHQEFVKWQKSFFKITFWKKSSYQEKLVFLFLQARASGVKVSKDKMKGIQQFFNGTSKSGFYKISTSTWITKSFNKVSITNKRP